MTVNNITTIVKNLSFDSVKEYVKNSDIKIKYNEELYLLSENKKNTYLKFEMNGLIFEKNSNNIVCACENKIKEFDELNNDNKTCNFQLEYCEDGTIIRLYNYKNKWYTATTRCIDATQSFWSSEKTFDNMFWETLSLTYNKEEFLSNLDIDSTYVFILLHTANRIVIKHTFNEIMYLKKINNKTLQQDSTILPGFKEKNIIGNFTGIIPTIHHLNNYYKNNKRGIIVSINNIKYKHDFQDYIKIKNIRGNVPLIRTRYIELLNNPNELQLLIDYYPEHHFLFTVIKHCLSNLYQNVHKLYIDTHVSHKIMITEHHQYYRIIKTCHWTYKQQNVIITLEEVTKIINSLPHYIIISLLKFA